LDHHEIGLEGVSNDSVLVDGDWVEKHLTDDGVVLDERAPQVTARPQRPTTATAKTRHQP